MFATVSDLVGVGKERLVSIPFRGFRCLQPDRDDEKEAAVPGFQSLSGVLGVCNNRLRIGVIG